MPRVKGSPTKKVSVLAAIAWGSAVALALTTFFLHIGQMIDALPLGVKHALKPVAIYFHLVGVYDTDESDVVHIDYYDGTKGDSHILLCLVARPDKTIEGAKIHITNRQGIVTSDPIPIFSSVVAKA
jgi:hypothetical protein